jgi:glycosyltransferase involved in cell wall biosynthesis
MASRVGNLAEIVDDGGNGQLVEPGNIERWSDALARAAANPATTIDRWRAGLRQPRTMDDIAADYLALYAA